jgi:hypothetical protein
LFLDSKLAVTAKETTRILKEENTAPFLAAVAQPPSVPCPVEKTASCEEEGRKILEVNLGGGLAAPCKEGIGGRKEIRGQE